MLHLVILGEPKAQKRARFARRGKFTKVYDPSSSDKDSFLSILQKNAPKFPFSSALKVDIHFYFTRPKSHYGSGKNAGKLKEGAPLWHTNKPDRDNLDKFVLDSLSGVYFTDDCVVCAGEIKKQYDEKPRTEIFIEVL